MESTPVDIFRRVFRLVIETDIEVTGTKDEIAETLAQSADIEFADILADTLWEEVQEDGTHYQFTVASKRSSNKVDADTTKPLQHVITLEGEE